MMILEVSALTSVKDLVIDFIQVDLKDGRNVALNWDESEIIRTRNGFNALYKGVYFEEIDATGKLDELRDMKIDSVGLYSSDLEQTDDEAIQDAGKLRIESIEIEDGDELLRFKNPKIRNIEWTW